MSNKKNRNFYDVAQACPDRTFFAKKILSWH